MDNYSQLAAARLQEAMGSLRAVIAAAPGDLEARGYLLQIADETGDYTTIIHQSMNCAAVSLARGDRLSALKVYEAILFLPERVSPDVATQVLQMVETVGPEIFLRLAEVRLDMGQHDEALQYLQQSNEWRPGVWETNMALGRAYLAKKRYKHAIGEFQEVVRLAGNDWQPSAEAYAWLGEIFVELGRAPHFTCRWFMHAAELYARHDHGEEARGCYARVLELDPDNQPARQALSEASPAELGENSETIRELRARGDFLGALRELDQLLQKRPRDVHARLYRGECLRVLERHQEAQENDQLLYQIASRASYYGEWDRSAPSRRSGTPGK
ncbi:tetratricopeptide repeat protein [bacterium]|nr:tetratricopeptide repeat protein [bacterium]